MSLFRTCAVAAVALAFASSSAVAASSSSATLDSISFQLFDLNPLDGPSTYNITGGSTSLSLSTNDGAVGDSDSSSRTRQGYLSFTRSFTSNLDHAYGTASISPSALSLTGAAVGASSSYSASAATGTASIALSAQSLLIITAKASVSALANNGTNCGTVYYYSSCGATESASANASMSLSYSFNANNGYTSISQSDSVGVSASAHGSYDQSYYYYSYYCYYYGNCSTTHYDAVNESKSDAKVFTFVFQNTSNTTQYASLSFNTSISGTAQNGPAQVMNTAIAKASIAAVPEPQGWALLMAGVGVVAAVARRRRVN